MSDNAIIQASYATIKPVRSRSVLQLIMEIPIEQSMHVMNILGFPLPGVEIPVAIARLQQVSAPTSALVIGGETPAASEKGVDPNTAAGD